MSAVRQLMDKTLDMLVEENMRLNQKLHEANGYRQLWKLAFMLVTSLWAATKLVEVLGW